MLTLTFHQFTQCHIPADLDLYQHLRNSLKYVMYWTYL